MENAAGASRAGKVFRLKGGQNKACCALARMENAAGASQAGEFFLLNGRQRRACRAPAAYGNASRASRAEKLFPSDVTMEKSWKFLAFCPAPGFGDTLPRALENPEVPKRRLPASRSPVTAPGNQAPVRPCPQPCGRKLRTSCFSESEHQKEKVSPPGVRESIPLPPPQKKHIYNQSPNKKKEPLL